MPRPKSGKVVNCDECGKETYCPPSRLKKNMHNFCSMKCFREWRVKHLRGKNSPIWQGNEVDCDFCGKNFMIQPLKLKTHSHHFCSMDCFNMWQSYNAPKGKDSPIWSSVNAKCEYCQKTFYTKLSEFKRFSRHFCSNECFYKWMYGHRKREENSNWKGGNRNKICEICGKTFVVYRPSYVDKQRFCSTKCQNIAHSIEMKDRWKDPDFRMNQGKLIVKGLKKRPTKPEKAIIEIIEKYNLPFRYNGDGSADTVISGFVPDFVELNGKKQIIEVFGDYWHKLKKDLPIHRTERGKKAIFYRAGYKTLVIWEKEINQLSEEDIVTKIQDFTSSS